MANTEKMANTTEKEGVYVRLPVSIWERFKALARSHRRSAASEAAVALEQYLNAHQAKGSKENG